MQATADNPTRRAIEWAAAHPGEMAWLEANMERNEFAASLAAQLGERGWLTPNQQAALSNKVAAQRAAPTVNVVEIEARFNVARERGVKKPAMRLDVFTFKFAGEEGRNAGGIYVTRKEGEESVYLGKVLGGRFLKVGDCTEEEASRIVAVAANPDEAARAYGMRTGCCSICGRELTAEESIDSFVGPICAERFGLPWRKASKG